MRYLLLPSQVPMFWEAIKKCVVDAGEIEEKERPAYFTDLLHALLSSKAQCFIRLSDERILEAIAITRLKSDKYKEQSSLYVEALYSWKSQGDSTWKEDMSFIHKFARLQKCSFISCQSRNPAVWRLYEIIGLKETYRTFAYYL